MLRRLTALLAMIALLFLVGVLVWQVYQHHRYRLDRDSGTIVNFARDGTLIS